MLTGDVTRSLVRLTTSSGTRMALQRPADVGAEVAKVWVVLFDGLPMIEDGVPDALASAQASGELPAVSAVYIESIEGAAKRGPTRCSSLTTATTLGRLAVELDAFLADSGRGDLSRTVLVGHSLGAIAALHLASRHPLLGQDVVLLSPALWWPGDDGQLSGEDVVSELVSAPQVGIWMTAGEQEEEKLLQSNDALFARISEDGRSIVRASRAGDHKVRPEDVVIGVRSLIGPLPSWTVPTVEIEQSL